MVSGRVGKGKKSRLPGLMLPGASGWLRGGKADGESVEPLRKSEGVRERRPGLAEDVVPACLGHHRRGSGGWAGWG